MHRFPSCLSSLFPAALAFIVVTAGSLQAADDEWVVYQGESGPGVGKKIVLVSGDDEYRSEEALSQLGKILAKHQGFTCTVLFPIDPADGTIKPHERCVALLTAAGLKDPGPIEQALPEPPLVTGGLPELLTALKNSYGFIHG